MTEKPKWENILREGERLDDLQRDGLKLIQNPSWFCFGMDAVLLSSFARVREGQECLDHENNLLSSVLWLCHALW